ncbi:hypothetical protein Tco_0579044 [Tanacetum coccineum]
MQKRVFSGLFQSRVLNIQDQDEVVKMPRACYWKEHERTSPTVPLDFIGPARNPFYGPIFGQSCALVSGCYDTRLEFTGIYLGMLGTCRFMLRSVGGIYGKDSHVALCCTGAVSYDWFVGFYGKLCVGTVASLFSVLGVSLGLLVRMLAWNGGIMLGARGIGGCHRGLALYPLPRPTTLGIEQRIYGEIDYPFGRSGVGARWSGFDWMVVVFMWLELGHMAGFAVGLTWRLDAGRLVGLCCALAAVCGFGRCGYRVYWETGLPSFRGRVWGISGGNLLVLAEELMVGTGKEGDTVWSVSVGIGFGCVLEESESDNLFHDHIQGEDENDEDVQMADHLRPMEELLRIPIVGIENAIIVPTVLANEFELKTELLDFVPHDVVKLILFPFSLKGAAETWLENEPPNSITSWDDLVSNGGISNQNDAITALTKQVKALISSMQEAYNRNQEASIQLMQNQMGQMEETFQERPSCVPPSDTETYPREERKAVTTMSGLTLDGSFIPHSNFLFYPEKDLEPETITEVVEIPSSQSTPLVPPPKTPSLSTTKTEGRPEV